LSAVCLMPPSMEGWRVWEDMADGGEGVRED
jgi:hypothetical protein